MILIEFCAAAYGIVKQGEIEHGCGANSLIYTLFLHKLADRAEKNGAV